MTDPLDDAWAAAMSEPPTATLRLTLQESWFARSTRGPWVRIDDVPVPTNPGDNILPVTAGHHTVSIVSAAQVGATTESEFEVASYEAVHLWYAPPAARFSAGRIGPEPQPDESRRFLFLVGVVMAGGLVYEAIRR